MADEFRKASIAGVEYVQATRPFRVYIVTCGSLGSIGPVASFATRSLTLAKALAGEWVFDGNHNVAIAHYDVVDTPERELR